MSLSIDDSNWQHVVEEDQQEGHPPGAIPRDWDEEPLGSITCAVPLSEDRQVRIIPAGEWKDRIRDMTLDGNFIGQRFQPDPRGYYQNGTPLCWAYSLGEAIEGEQAGSGLDHGVLGVESVMGVCNWRTQGYYPSKAIQWASEHGMARREFVEMYSSNPRSFKPGWEEDALQNVPLEWWEGGGKDMWAETLTVLLSGKGCYVGYDWWRHAVWLDMARVDEQGRIGVHTPNSHGPGKDVWLTGSRAIPGEMYAIRSMTYRRAA